MRTVTISWSMEEKQFKHIYKDGEIIKFIIYSLNVHTKLRIGSWLLSGKAPYNR